MWANCVEYINFMYHHRSVGFMSYSPRIYDVSERAMVAMIYGSYEETIQNFKFDVQAYVIFSSTKSQYNHYVCPASVV